MREISVQDLKFWKESGKDFQLIDIREYYEIEWANIGGEVLPMDTILENVSKINKSGEVVLHCNTGMRSKAIIDILEKKYNYSNLINLKGGMEAWAKEIDSSKLAY